MVGALRVDQLIGRQGQAAALGLPKPGGVLIKDVYPGGPLGKAGVKSGDVVQSVDGAAVARFLTAICAELER